jgi:hypothetical protein
MAFEPVDNKNRATKRLISSTFRAEGQKSRGEVALEKYRIANRVSEDEAGATSIWKVIYFVWSIYKDIVMCLRE